MYFHQRGVGAVSQQALQLQLAWIHNDRLSVDDGRASAENGPAVVELVVPESRGEEEDQTWFSTESMLIQPATTKLRLVVAPSGESRG